MTAPVNEGEVLAGKYRVERVLGEGGMGIVVAARHLQLDDRVAIKFLRPEAARHSEVVARFQREGRAAVRIKSEHVARVTDVGTLENGAPYMVMEYLDGSDLSALVRERGPLPVEVAVEYLLQACEALAEAHALGIIHRDLKPANLFLVARADGSPCVKVLDFGISKVTGPTGSVPEASVTKTAAILGSPLYMSPEQLTSSRDVDARTDLWALGVILYELITARQPFEGEAYPQLVAAIMSVPAVPIEQHRPDLPAALAAAIARCLEKDKARRWPNVAELALALLPFGPKRSRTSADRISKVIHGAGLSASALALPPSTDPMPANAVPASTSPDTVAKTSASWGHTGAGEARTRRGPTLVVAGVVLAAVVAIGVGAMLMRGGARTADGAPAGGTAPPSTAALAPVEPITTPAQVAAATPATSIVVAPAPAVATGAPPSASASTDVRDRAAPKGGKAPGKGKPAGGDLFDDSQ